MPDATQQPVFRWTAARVRLIAAILIGSAIFALSFRLGIEMRLLLAYDLALSAYLTLQLVRMMHADEAATRELSEKIEASNAAVLTAAALLSACSLAGVGFMLQRSRNWTALATNVHLGLSLLAVFLSWALMHVVFGIHYARLYYDPTPPAGEPAVGRPLEFPDDAQPDFWDFMYFAFTLAVCYQVSDITIRSRHLRRVALAHMLLSFLNVTMILGLVVEIISTLA
jgi:uncharacterized membrane protein